MQINITRKDLLSWLLIFIPLSLLISQQINGYLPVREGTNDAVWWSVILLFLMVLGYTMQVRTLQAKTIYFLVSIGAFLLLPMAISGFIAIQDGSLAEGIDDYGYLYSFHILGSEVGTSTNVIYQGILILPIVAIGVITMLKLMAGFQKGIWMDAIFEAVITALIVLISCLFLNWLGALTAIA